MLLDLLDCMTAPAGVLTPFAPTAIGNNINLAAVIDRVTAMDDGPGAVIDFVTYVSAAVTSAGAATVEIQLLGNATDPTFSSNNVVLFDTGAAGVPKATLVSGYRFLVGRIPRAAFTKYENATGIAGGPVLRYLTINVIIGTATLTTGSFNAWLSPAYGTQDSISYKAGFSV